MEKRVLLAFVLSFVVLITWNVLFPTPEPSRPTPAPTSAPATASPASPPPATGTDPGQVKPAQPAPGVEAPAALLADSVERDVVVENDLVRALFANRGAVLKSWRLKQYKDAAGQPLELVPQNVPPGTPRPFTLTLEDADLTSRLGNALFKPGVESLNVARNPGAVTFEYRDAAGLQARKTFAFAPEHPYVVSFSADVKVNGATVVPTVNGGASLGTGLGSASSMAYGPAPQPVFYRDGDVTRIGVGDLAQTASHEGRFVFAGVDDHYFLSAVVPKGSQPLRVQYRPVPGTAASDGGRAPAFVAWSVGYAASPSNAQFFLGPKDFDHLKAVDPTLTYAIHFGVFRWFVVPLLDALKGVNRYVSNWGWSILILTVIINLAMFPLRHKSVVSMRKMQELQPEVKAIQERYSKLKLNDPARQKMNVELMNLYRERGVNPASGCVPMLLTLPVLFAFYSMLSVAIELRGAPFVGWIRDLSAHDPLFITPILMGVTMVVQQKMTPTTMSDPVQQKMMMFMPIVFTFTFLWMPAGLVLYWTASNIWAIGQQALTNKLIGPPQTRNVRPPAERRVKKIGSGKTDQASKEPK
jgi:YidC/Oxa1 family membrane protein insertase